MPRTNWISPRGYPSPVRSLALKGRCHRHAARRGYDNSADIILSARQKAIAMINLPRTLRVADETSAATDRKSSAMSVVADVPSAQTNTPSDVFGLTWRLC